jgi:hypothetical protein
MKLHTKTLGALLAASFAVLTSAHAQFVWTGTTSSDASDSSNYSGTAPTFGGTDAAALDVNDNAYNGTPVGNPMIYSAAQGTTVFTGALNVGANYTTLNSEFEVTGGNVTFSANSFPSSVGFASSNSSTISVSGGVLNFNGAFTGGGGPDSLWLSNETTSIFDVSGGTVNIQQELAFARDGGTATLNITGGVFDVQGATGTLFNGSNNNASNGVINISNGEFEETASDSLNLTASKFTVNFTAGSGSLSLFSADSGAAAEALLSADVTAGLIQDNGTTNASAFSITTSGDTATVALVAPEPSTWAMLIGGFALLIGVQRLSRQRNV